MKNNYDVIIVGAGPAGIFTALEMLRKGTKQSILIIEKGKAIEKRSCPKHKLGKCINCKPCNITTGFSGAGAFSDGKYNITNDFGGTLYEYIGKKQALELMQYVDNINVLYVAFTRAAKAMSIISRVPYEDGFAQWTYAFMQDRGTEMGFV